MLQPDDEAVSPVIGVLLSVLITVALGAIVFLTTTNMDSGVNQRQLLSFVVDERGGDPGGVMTLVKVTHGTIKIEDVELGGTSHFAAPCQWSHPTGDLVAGDQLVCSQPGTITITDIQRKYLLYSGSFS